MLISLLSHTHHIICRTNRTVLPLRMARLAVTYWKRSPSTDKEPTVIDGMGQ
jgi:hypothetical protein